MFMTIEPATLPDDPSQLKEIILRLQTDHLRAEKENELLREDVITSYSIHYTKLYESCSQRKSLLFKIGYQQFAKS